MVEHDVEHQEEEARLDQRMINRLANRQCDVVMNLDAKSTEQATKR